MFPEFAELEMTGKAIMPVAGTTIVEENMLESGRRDMLTILSYDIPTLWYHLLDYLSHINCIPEYNGIGNQMYTFYALLLKVCLNKPENDTGQKSYAEFVIKWWFIIFSTHPLIICKKKQETQK